MNKQQENEMNELAELEASKWSDPIQATLIKTGFKNGYKAFSKKLENTIANIGQDKTNKAYENIQRTIELNKKIETMGAGINFCKCKTIK